VVKVIQRGDKASEKLFSWLYHLRAKEDSAKQTEIRKVYREHTEKQKWQQEQQERQKEWQEQEYQRKQATIVHKRRTDKIAFLVAVAALVVYSLIIIFR
jgi:glucose-6-phosphate 1-dehydrogenase